ncbi:MAG: glycosyltransferase, partial [Eudoraea sp.]
IGMKTLNHEIFLNKNWGTETVLEDTLSNLTHKEVQLLQIKNDIDVYEDLKEFDVFQSFVKI